MRAPSITALVCTRNRGSLPAETVRTIMTGNHQNFELRVIDQSRDNVSEESLAEWMSDPRFHYTRSTTEGLSRARNIGFAQAQAEIVAMTDDDCRVPEDWLHRMESVFSSTTPVDVILGNVIAAAHDSSRGFISSYRRKSSFIASSVRDKPKVEGIGACMGIRTKVWSALGGFDPMLGAGSKFNACDDADFVIRALLAGYRVGEFPEVHVEHHGFRTWADGRDLIRGYMFGIGGMLAKHLRCGHWGVLHVARALARRWMFGRPVVDFGFTPARSLRLGGFVRGFLAGLAAPVDYRSGLFDPGELLRNRSDPIGRSSTGLP